MSTRLNKTGHLWIKAAGNGHYCAICGCTRESRQIHLNKEDRYGRERLTYYMLNGVEHRESPLCKK